MKFKITNVEAQPVMTHTLGTDYQGKMRNKLTVLDVAGMPWKEKRDWIHKELVTAFGEIPDGVMVVKRKTKPDKWNPDGLRIMVHCAWLKRQRFDDYRGDYKLGTLIKAINKQIDGKTKRRLLKKI